MRSAHAARFIHPFLQHTTDNYRPLNPQLLAALQAALPYFQGQPFRIRPKMVYDVIKALAKGRKDVAYGAHIMSQSIEQVLEEHFTREEIKAPLGTYSMASWGPPSEPATGLYMAVLTGIHQWGVQRPVGGSGQFTRAIAACIVDHGGEVRTNAPVAQINTRAGRATGVTLANGEEIQARQVIAACDPVTLGTKLIDPGDLPISTHEQLRGLQVSRYGIYIYKADLALRARPRFTGMGHQDVDPRVLSTLTLCQSMADLKKSAYLGMTGDYDANIPLTTIIPSIEDRSLVPEGSDGDTLYIYGFNTPIELRDGRSWEDESQKYYRACMDVFDTYAPGTSDLVLDKYLTSPPEFETRYNVHKGNYSHVDLTPGQLGPWRPIPDFAGYKTPIDGLWHTGSGAFPMSYLSGWPGRNTARRVAQVLDKTPTSTVSPSDAKL